MQEGRGDASRVGGRQLPNSLQVGEGLLGPAGPELELGQPQVMVEGSPEVRGRLRGPQSRRPRAIRDRILERGESLGHPAGPFRHARELASRPPVRRADREVAGAIRHRRLRLHAARPPGADRGGLLPQAENLDGIVLGPVTGAGMDLPQGSQ